MRQQSISKPIGADIHIGLMTVVFARGSMEQCKAKRRGRRLVPTILAVGENRNAIAIGRHTMVGPLVAAHLILVAATDSALNSAKRNVVSVVCVAECKREINLEHTFVCLPIYLVYTLHTVVQGIHTNVLHERGAFLLTLDAQGFSQRTIFHKFHLHCLGNIRRRGSTHICITYFPSGPCVFVVVDELLADCRTDESTEILLVVEIRDVAISIYCNTISAVGEPSVVARLCVCEIGCKAGLLAYPGFVDGIAKRGDCCGEDEVQTACGEIVTGDLREDFVAIGIEHTDCGLETSGVERTFYNVCAFV